jgi:CyaY protein
MLARGFTDDLRRMTPTFTQADFEALADAALEQIQLALEASGSDADVESKADGVIELTFEDDSRMVINRHGAAREIWVAARSGGFHFRWDGSAWRDTREGTELFAALSKLVSAQGGAPVVLAPRARS